MHNVQSSLSEEKFFHYVENLKLWTIKFALDDWHPSYVESQIFFVYLLSLRYTESLPWPLETLKTFVCGHNFA